MTAYEYAKSRLAHIDAELYSADVPASDEVLLEITHLVNYTSLVETSGCHEDEVVVNIDQDFWASEL